MSSINEVPQTERWLTKKQLADHFQFSTKWVDRRILEGLPHARFGRQKRFRISNCEAWLSAMAASEMAVV